jgi:glycosyltransferase involved in cell wall biosynthesis
MISKAVVVGTYQRKLQEIAHHPDVDLTVIVPPLWKDGGTELVLERAYTEGYRLSVEPIRFNGNFHMHYYPTLGRRIHEIKPDVVHIDEEPYNLATWHALYHAKRIDAKTLFFSWQNIRRDYPLPFRWGERWVLNSVDHAIIGTQSAADVWRAKGYKGAISVIPQFGIDPDLFTPEDRTESAAFRIGYAGRLVPEKGIDLLIRAASRLAGEQAGVPPIELHIVGSGSERAALERATINYNIRTLFYGHVPSMQMRGYYRQMDVLVIPSRTLPNWKEQFGRVIVEAMACGVPVIGSNSGAIPDVIGEAGEIFPEDDEDALVASLRRVIANPELRTQMARRGRQRVLEKYTHKQVATETVGVYRMLVSR